MEKTSKHIGDLFMIAGRKFKENFWNAMSGVIVFLSPFFVVVALQILLYRHLGAISTAFGWLFIVAFANVMVVGLIAFFNELFDGKNPSPLRVFSGFASPSFSLILFLGISMFVLYIVGTVLLIVPAFLLVANFSMVFFFVEKYEYMDVAQALSTCRKQMIGNRASMVIYKLLYYIVYALLIFVVLLFANHVIIPLVSATTVWSILLVVLSVVVILLLFALLTAHFHITNHVYFEEVLAYNVKKVKKAVKTEEVKTETVAEEKPAPAKVETAEKPAAKPAAKKETTPANIAAKPKAATAAKPKTATAAKPATTTAAKPKTAAKPTTKK